VTGRVIQFPRRSLSSEAGRRAAECILATPLSDRNRNTFALQVEDPETLLSLCEFLRGGLESSPAVVLTECGYVYRLIRASPREIGLFDERDYFLGEIALLAGTACRQLAQRDEARLWFDRSEAGFRHTVNAAGDLSRLGYQRLALRLEERQIPEVLELVPPLIESLESLGMPDEALKCRFLEGLAMMESDELTLAAQIFRDICDRAERLDNQRLLASAYGNLTHVYGMLGNAEEAIAASGKALPILHRLGDRVALAKVQWGLATLLRESGQVESAVEAYRQAQKQFETLGMRADIAALNLVIADLLLDQGQDAEALQEISAALPVIDELKMAPEGMAALSLLRESARRHEINRAALRELHGYFPQPQA